MPGQASEHDFDHGASCESHHCSGVAFEVAHEAAIAADPAERSLDDPSFGHHGEGVQFTALDDLNEPTAGALRGQRHTRSLIAGIGEDFHDERPESTRAPVEHQFRAIAVLDVGGVNGNAQEQAKRVDKDVPLAARDFLGAVKALRIDLRPPFGAAFTV